MKHAFLITAYKDIEQLYRLISKLQDKDFYFFIHFDKKSTDLDLTVLKELSNVQVLPIRYNVNWASLNHLHAIIELIKVSYNQNDFDFFHLLTGQCYPAKSSKYIKEFFFENINSNFIEINPISFWNDGGYSRLNFYHLFDLIDAKKFDGWKWNERIVRLQKKINYTRSINNLPPLYGGSTYWSLNKKCIDYCLKYINYNAWFLKRFKHTYCSEEIFFQTIIFNSELKESIVNDNLRFISWIKKNNSLPAFLDDTDYKKIKESNKIFVRKIDSSISKGLINLLDQE